MKNTVPGSEACGIIPYYEARCIKKDRFLIGPLLLIVFTLTSSFRLFLTSYAWLLVMLSFTNLLLDAGLRTVSLKTTKSAV